jgi:LysM repeat protein
MIFLRKFNLLVLLTFYSMTASGQRPAQQSRLEYIDNYKDLAIKEMLRSGVPASITLAQGILESDNGNSSLAKKANNHFGIKCHSNWKGPNVYHDDDSKGECFRKYKTVYESYQDHSDFLMSGARYSSLFQLKMTDYKGWARGLKKAGYATSPTYSEMLIKLIEEHNLQQYDLAGDSQARKQKQKKIDEGKSSGASAGRKILERNRIKYIITEQDDNFRTLQEEFQLLPFEIFKYNDLERDQELSPGQVIYLQPKRNKAEVGNSYHTVKAGETMLQISQNYGIKIEKLYSKNLLTPGYEPKAGEKISLRKQVYGTKPPVEKRKKVKNSEQEEDSEMRFEFDK